MRHPPGELVRSDQVPLVEVVATAALDAAVLPRLRELLYEALALRPERLVVDVTNCPRIDPPAIAVLLTADQKAARVGSQMVVREQSDHHDPQLARAAGELRVIRRAAGSVTASDSCDSWAAMWVGA